MLTLLCTQLHPTIPALTPGVAITLDRLAHGGLAITVPGTPTVLQRIAAAIRDGALVLTDSTDPGIAELDRLIVGERDRLLAEADAMVAASHQMDRAG